MPSIEILIADGNKARAERVACALEAEGHPCEVVSQGALALEVALAAHPRIVVAETDLELVDAAKLAEILRANPRTRTVRFLFLGANAKRGQLGGIGDASLDASAEIDTVIEAVSSLLDRQCKVDDLEDRTENELEFCGELSELGPAELMQALHVRRATGVLELRSGGAERLAMGRVIFQDGEMFSAELGPIRGEKALFRMLDWRAGEFEFAPSAETFVAEILSPTRALLAEGLRQLDEWARLAPNLPPMESPVRLIVNRNDLPQLVHPLTQEVLGLLDEYDFVRDVVDHCSRPDYQVLRTLHTLSERGIAEFGRVRVGMPDAEEQGTLFSDAQIRRLKSFARSGLSKEDGLPDAKLVVVPASPLCLSRFAAALEKIGNIEVDPRYARGDIGSTDFERMARVDVDGDFGIDLIHLPACERFEAVAGWAGFGALGTLILLDASVAESARKVAAIADTLTSRPGARNFNVVLLGGGERVAPAELQENLALIDQASLFLLPVEADRDCRSLLQSLFSRIVP